MRKIATGRIVGLLIAVVGIGLSVFFACEAGRRNAEFHRWFTARPMETAIDLSQPGETTVPFHQTCSVSHGEGLFLAYDLDNEPTQDTGILLSGLDANVAIQDSDSNVIETVKIDNQTARFWNGAIMLNGIAPFPKGEYVAVLHVATGASRLAGKRQTIYAKYQLCGLERMPAVIAGGFASVSGILGLVAAVCVLPGLLRHGFRRGVSTEDARQGS